MKPLSIENAQIDVPINDIEKQEFEKSWLYKPVSLKGIFDHDNENLIQRTVGGERGYEVLTPFYTGVDKQGQLQGIIVNRGRIPFDYRNSKMHLTPPNEEQVVEALIFYTEGPLKVGGKINEMKKDLKDGQLKKTVREGGQIKIDINKMIDQTELSHLPENDIARRCYLKVCDLTFNSGSNEDKLPKPSSAQDLCNFYVMPARHQAYSNFWLYASFLNVAGNVALWIYL